MLAVAVKTCALNSKPISALNYIRSFATVYDDVAGSSPVTGPSASF